MCTSYIYEKLKAISNMNDRQFQNVICVIETAGSSQYMKFIRSFILAVPMEAFAMTVPRDLRE